jgi:hypothetical protein
MFASLVRLAAVTTLLFTAPASARKNIILDTDIFSDCEYVPPSPFIRHVLTLPATPPPSKWPPHPPTSASSA